MQAVRAAWDRLRRTTAWRTWQRYGDARGNLLAGGVAYFAFFSIFPAVALAFTAFGLVLRGRPELLDRVRTALEEALPGFVRDGDRGLIPLEIPTGTTLSVTAVLGLLGLLWAGLGWLGALRDGIRIIFGLTGGPGNVVTDKLRDLGVLVALGVAILVSGTVTGVAGAAAAEVAAVGGATGQRWLVQGVTLLIGLVLDSGIVLIMLRLLSGIPVPRVGLRRAAIAGGVGLTVLKTAGTSALGAMDNPLFASIALVVGLLAWLNLMSRVVLLSAAYAATHTDLTRPDPQGE